MKKTRFSEEQMVKILHEADSRPVAEVAKKHGVSDATIYAWRKRFGSLEPVDVKRPSYNRYNRGRYNRGQITFSSDLKQIVVADRLLDATHGRSTASTRPGLA